MSLGFDTATACSGEFIDKMRNTGYKFAARYYCSGSSNTKRLTPDEATRFMDAGFELISVWQDYNDEYSFFNYQMGSSHAATAYSYAKTTVLQPAGTPIYFAVDFDATLQQLQGNIRDYFMAVSTLFENMGGEYTVGVYGSGRACAYLKEQLKLCTHSWLAGAKYWGNYNSYLESRAWNLRQYCINSQLDGIYLDLNEGSGEISAGSWSFLTQTQTELLSMRLDAIESRESHLYSSLGEIPEWALSAVQDALDKGILEPIGDDPGLNLSYNDLRKLVWDFREESLDHNAGCLPSDEISVETDAG